MNKKEIRASILTLIQMITGKPQQEVVKIYKSYKDDFDDDLNPKIIK